MIRLNPMQKMALPALEWWLSNDVDTNDTGRTFLAAVIVIRKALAIPGTKVGLQDHRAYQCGQLAVKEAVIALLTSVEMPGMAIESEGKWLEITPPPKTDTRARSLFEKAAAQFTEL